MTLTRIDQLNQYPAAPDPALPEELEEERVRGYAGGLISQHRAMAREPQTATKILASVALLIAVFEGWLLIFDWVVVAWAEILEFWRQVFGWEGYVVIVDYQLGVSAPYIAVASGLPGRGLWMLGALMTLLLFGASLFLPRPFLPVAYLMRIAAFFQACAQAFFALIPRWFPYGASGYIHGMLIAGLALITLVPILLGFTYYIFDVGVGKKLGLTLLVMFHLTLFIPLQYMAHAFVLYHLSLLFLPILFFVFGLPLNVLVFIGFYSWGASWRSLGQTAALQPRPRSGPDAEVAEVIV